MAEQERERLRERETIPGAVYERAYETRSKFVDLGKNGVVVVRSSDREWELCRQGLIKPYLIQGQFPETVLQDWWVFVHEIRKESGKHRHQGGLVLYVVEGRGATEVNGEIVEWEEGDLILLPLHPEGIEHKHYNREAGRSAKWLALIYLPAFDHVSSELTQTEIAPDYEARYG